MEAILYAWIGKTDLRASQGDIKSGRGPIGQTMIDRGYRRAILLSNYPKDESLDYRIWLKKLVEADIELILSPLPSPTCFSKIYQSASNAVLHATEADPKNKTNLVFHISPGTPAMAAVWIILAKTRFPAEIIESSQDHGVQTVSVPFDISADFIPDLLQSANDDLQRLGEGLPPAAPEFHEIVGRCEAMRRLVTRARRVAPRSEPVLLLGESGTGKELFARAIHAASLRKGKVFQAVNCGAIAHDLVESELFGHEKGAFTGAGNARAGYFETATGGTLFLDELGELPLSGQAKLLRVLQEGEVTRVGASRVTRVDVRVIAATNRNLMQEVIHGRFREDLFHRLAVAVLQIPPLRERQGDLNLLIDHLLDQVNQKCAGQPGHRDMKLSAAARAVFLRHSWPGNVRELYHTLCRAVLWSTGPVIDERDALQALLPVSDTEQTSLLNRHLGEGFRIEDSVREVAVHYLKRAIETAGGNKTKAAELLGLGSYQRFDNWWRKYITNAGEEV